MYLSKMLKLIAETMGWNEIVLNTVRSNREDNNYYHNGN